MPRYTLSPERWNQIILEYFNSGLSRRQFYYRRFPDLAGDESLPSLKTLCRRISAFTRRNDAAATARSYVASVSVRELSDDVIAQALAKQRSSCIPSKTDGAVPVKLSLADGSLLEFESTSPELLALSLYKMSLTGACR